MNDRRLRIMDDVSDGISVCFSDSFILSDPVRTPVNVEK